MPGRSTVDRQRVSTFPGLAVMLTGLAFSLLGDGLADALELPR
jgi:ABC-type dipeptide/oligopeptide/nickel transport system permease subunit